MVCNGDIGENMEDGAKEISTSFLGLVATPHKVAKIMGALSPE